ncbi:MAG: hypothetical protein IKE60_08045 [Reyranella sp.]|jgi:ribonuclease E|uniref:hypothetical protein n=1 Tax=Reyranella sp. TaxID=1929291 RepID=UPI00095E59B4|nr:hypothetical protein [Reyranella sp.]MBN9537311.1 hypothetical protein [Alphaproteobacteria bacterium]MBR2814589.1 hypothetical protein [Reyranella sp.]OJU32451.1 MAG: hypothetical protein BGN99_11985 [Alphaproteobacteria bacterium 65-37]
MENRAHSDTASGIFRMRKDDPLTTDGIIVDMHDETYTTLTTVEVRNGAVMLHCLASWEDVEASEEVEEEEEASDESDDEEDEDEADEDEDEEDEEDEEEAEESDDGDGRKAKTYTVASGNSLTVRATAVRLEPVGPETAEGTYRVQMIRSTDY